MLTFNSLRSARSFIRGYCVPRVIVRYRGKFAICSPSTARRRGLKAV